MTPRQASIPSPTPTATVVPTVSVLPASATATLRKASVRSPTPTPIAVIPVPPSSPHRPTTTADPEAGFHPIADLDRRHRPLGAVILATLPCRHRRLPLLPRAAVPPLPTPSTVPETESDRKQVHRIEDQEEYNLGSADGVRIA
uniref:Uncharacterized protein n=1 Tax=Oryza brachyantha TaxID=4533 RepID=J3MK30_ORYBR